MRKALLIIVLCLQAAISLSLAQENLLLKTDFEKQTLIAQLEEIVPELMEKASIPGLSVAVIKDGEIIWSRGFGIKNTKTNEPVTESTIFEAASLTKPFFAYFVMKMVESGELNLDTPLIKYAPKEYIEEKYIRHPMEMERFRRDWFERITARMVLSHSSGLPHGEPRNPLPVFFEPGTKYKYSADGYEYLQRIVEYLKGKPLHEIMEKMVIGPLGMKDSSMVWQEKYESQSAVGHNTFNDTSGEFRKRTQAHAAASLYTTAADYARFVRAMINDVGLKNETIHQMLTPQIEVKKDVSWGLGFGLGRTENGDAFWQWGDYGIFRNYAVAYKKQKIGIVYLTNSNNGLSIGQEIVNHAIGGGKDPGLAYLDYEHYSSPQKNLIRTIQSKGIKEAVLLFNELKKKSPEIVDERGINRIGYTLMNSGRITEAIEIFKINVEAFPGSANVYDSLAEAYMKNGDERLAVQFYEKAVEMTAKDTKADKEFLERLKKGALEKLERLKQRMKRRISQEEAEKKYAEFVGVWEFKVEGYGTWVLKIYIDDGLLWGIPEGDTIDNKSEFIPVEGKELEFKVDSPQLGMFEWEFLKDDEGKITKCRFNLKSQGLEAFGIKRLSP